MKKQIKMVYVIIMALVSVIAVIAAYSQEDVAEVRDSAFTEKMRPSVRFLHDGHNENAGIDECNVCHHKFENGKKLEDESSEDMECSECHQPEGRGNSTELAKAYHARCKECHAERKAGPVMCGECHVKSD